MSQGIPVLELEDASVNYSGGSEAVTGVSIRLHRGEILGLVGESGCGKSTTARAMLGLIPLSAGRLLLHGQPVSRYNRRQRPAVQAIFQNPAASFNPKRSLLDSVAEPLRVHRRLTAAERRRQAVIELNRVGISEQMAVRRPREVSGGQCQRAAIARATILRPEVLICDEPVSALDVSIQAQILELLASLRTEHGLAMLFISHDLNVVASLCDRTAVMYAGRLAEEGPTLHVANDPRHPYAVTLEDSAWSLDPNRPQVPRLGVVRTPDDVDGRRLPGCRFAALCPSVTDECKASPPEFRELDPGHSVACYHPFSGRPQHLAAASGTLPHHDMPALTGPPT